MRWRLLYFERDSHGTLVDIDYVERTLNRAQVFDLSYAERFVRPEALKAKLGLPSSAEPHVHGDFFDSEIASARVRVADEPRCLAACRCVWQLVYRNQGCSYALTPDP
jgi:hypothetical protein